MRIVIVLAAFVAAWFPQRVLCAVEVVVAGAAAMVHILCAPGQDRPVKDSLFTRRAPLSCAPGASWQVARPLHDMHSMKTLSGIRTAKAAICRGQPQASQDAPRSPVRLDSSALIAVTPQGFQPRHTWR